MQDRYVIMGTGFKNTTVNGTTTGYQFRIRIPYYRSVFLSAVHTLELAVDDEDVSAKDIHIMVGGKTFSIPEMYEADSVRWGFGDPATLFVTRAGGLKPGGHSFKLGIVIRKSYLPATDPERLYSDFPGLYKDGKYSTYIEAPTVIRKHMTLVQ